MRVLLLCAAMPDGIDVHWRNVKRQGPEYQLLCNTRYPDEMARQNGQQIGGRNYTAGCKKLVHRQHDLTLSSQRGEGLIDKPVRPA